MQTLPREIHKGMAVLDRANSRIGTIEDFRFSQNQEDPDTEPAEIDAIDRREDSTLLGDIAEAFVPDDMPEEMRERLMLNGYVRLDASGLFAADRYILPEQISAVNGDRLVLNVSRDELMKSH